MPRFPVVYASTHGQTAKIASRIGETLGADGHAASVNRFGAAELPSYYDAVIAGALLHQGRHQQLQHREYDFTTRIVMRLMMRRGGHPTDTGRDFDYTDWAAVVRFARDCERMVGAPAH